MSTGEALVPTAGQTELVELPAIPEEVVVEFVMPYAFGSMREALHLMLVCRAAHRAATTRRAFWEPFLWRRLHEQVIPWLEIAYHKYSGRLVDLLRAKYVMWPTSLENDSRYGGGGLMAMVRSKFFVAQQVPDLWGHLNPISCSDCDCVLTSPWWRCLDCPKDKDDYILCISPHNCRYAEEDEEDSSTDEDGEDDDDDDQRATSDEESSGEDPSATDYVAEDGVVNGQKEEDGEEHRQEPISEPEGEFPSRSEDTEEAAEVEPTEKQEDAPSSADGIGEEDETKEEGGNEPKSAHKPDHRLQLVVENPQCSLCDEPVHKAWWCCPGCLRKRKLKIVCDACEPNRELIAEGMPCLSRGEEEEEPRKHVLERWTEGVEFIDRWSIEAPHPPLTFAQAWNEERAKGKYTGLRLLKMYAPRFTNYGCYTCFFEDRPSLTEGWIIDGAIRYGIKYTGWPKESHVFEGQFEETQEGFPDGPGRREWLSGLVFTGDIHMHRLAGEHCTLEMVDGSKFEGSLLKEIRFMQTKGKGVLTFPTGRRVDCRLETFHGRHCDMIHFWTKPNPQSDQAVERFVLCTRRGILEPVDMFEDTDEEEESEEEKDDEPQADSEQTNATQEEPNNLSA